MKSSFANFKTELYPRPFWYDEIVHNTVVALLKDGKKLNACKVLCDTSSANDTRQEFDLKWAKFQVCDVLGGYLQYEGNAVSEREIQAVTDIITNEILITGKCPDLYNFITFVPADKIR